MPVESQERLQKFLAQAGIASRRKAEQLIQEGRVTVNGRIVTLLGTKVNPAVDDVRVDGQKVKVAGRHVYILLNKPRGTVSTMEDPRGHKALGDLVQVPQRVFPVGRLDVTSEGLILLTDDGDLANLLTHPRYEHEKEYRVLVNGTPSDETLDAWGRGVVLEGERTAPAQVEVVRRDKDATLLRVIMHEGRKRQLRDVAALLGHPVRQLQRVRLGPLHLGILKPGEWRHLNDGEIEELTAVKRKAAGSKQAEARGKAQKARGKTPEAGGKAQEAQGKKQEPRGKTQEARGGKEEEQPAPRRKRPAGRDERQGSRDGERSRGRAAGSKPRESKDKRAGQRDSRKK
jgi:23S rRNA pseudouridine2605 synthase